MSELLIQLDTRLYQKTIIITNNIAVICRENVDTKKIHSVKVDADAWLNYYKSDTQSTSFLKDAGASESEINFISKNIIEGETPEPKNIKKEVRKAFNTNKK